MDPSQRKEIYEQALHFVTEEGRKDAENSVREKIMQRTTGGAFAIRKAFKVFDADGSGDIDPDEFKRVMLSFGLTFTDRQVLCLFGSYDEDCSGALDYYEFLDRVLEADYYEADGTNVNSCRPKTPPRRHYIEQLDLYRQMVRLKQMYDFCSTQTSNRISVDEARNFLMECGHGEPDEDCVLQICQATCATTNGGLIFTELWDWFTGALEVPLLDISPQMKVNTGEEESGSPFKDAQGRKHMALKKMMSKAGLHQSTEASAEEMAQWRRARVADVDNDGSASAEEIATFHAKQREDIEKLKKSHGPQESLSHEGDEQARREWNESKPEMTPLNFNKLHLGCINYHAHEDGSTKAVPSMVKRLDPRSPKPPSNGQPPKSTRSYRAFMTGSRPQTVRTSESVSHAKENSRPSSSRTTKLQTRPFMFDKSIRPSTARTSDQLQGEMRTASFFKSPMQNKETARPVTARAYKTMNQEDVFNRPSGITRQSDARPQTARIKLPANSRASSITVNLPRLNLLGFTGRNRPLTAR